MNIVIGTSIGGAAVIYEIIAIFGYLTFGSKVCMTILMFIMLSVDFICLGSRQYHCNVPIHVTLHCFRSTRHRRFGDVLLPVASTPM